MINKYFEDLLAQPTNITRPIIDIRGDELGSPQLRDIGSRLVYIIENTSGRKKISLNIYVEKIRDNAVIQVLELLLYSAFLQDNSVEIKLRVRLGRHYTFRYFVHSLLFEYNNNFINQDKFRKSIESYQTLVEMPYYRKRIKYSTENIEDRSVPCSEIYAFLKHSGLNFRDTNEISQVAAELINNGLEHGNSDVIVEVHLMDNIIRKVDNMSGRIITVTVLNCSDRYFFSGLEELFNKAEFSYGNAKLPIAYEHHSMHFNEDYTFKKFLMVSAFQRGISSRVNQGSSGGTGLTTCLIGISDKVSSNQEFYAYLLSSDEVLFFNSEKIIEKNGEIGFNQENNYLSSIPEPTEHGYSSLKFKGTLFFLQLFIEEDRYGDN